MTLLTTEFGGYWDYWQLYHKVTFDGPNRRIIINPGETVIDVQDDIYSSWKEWALLEFNLRYPAALRTTGGDPLDPLGTQQSGRYYFLINGWKLVPPEDINTLDGINLNGNLFADDGSDIFVTRGNEVLIRQTVSQLTQVVEIPVTASVDVTASIGAGTIVTASLLPGQTVATASYVDYVDTIGNVEFSGSIDSVLTASYVETIGSPVQIASGQTIESASYVGTIGTPVELAPNQIIATASYIGSPVELAPGQVVTASLDSNQIISASLTGAQETMLMEMYRIFGLDPTRPLVVSPESRTAGPEVSQSISKAGDVVTVQRT